MANASNNKLMRYVGSTLAVILISGCQSGLYQISTSEEDKKIDDSVQYYEITSGKDTSETRFMKDGGTSPEGVLYDESQMPIEIVDGKSEKVPDNGGLSGVLWLCTVGIWPMCHSEYMTQDISVKTPIGEKSGSYRVDAKWWAGWFPIFIGYPGSADERSAEATLPNQRIEGLAKDRLIKSLVGEFSFKDYVAFAKKENASRKDELERIETSKRAIDELLSKNKYDEAIALYEADSKKRSGSLKKDQETWAAMRKLINDKREDCRVATKKTDLEKKFSDKKFEEVVSECNNESKGEARHASIWAEIKANAEKAISERDRKIELARIEKRKMEISKLLNQKKYEAVIAECNKETGANAGSRSDDLKIWEELRTKAQTAKNAIDREAETKRIAEKLKKVDALLAEKKFSEVVKLCEEERGQNAGSRSEDLAQWKTIRARALANDLLSNTGRRSKSTYCLKGFYLGMTLEEAEILLDYYFPKITHKRSDNKIVLGGRAMEFCEAKSDQVVCINFDKKMLEQWFEYDYQTHRDWAVNFAKETSLDLRAGTVKDQMDLGDYGSIDVAQDIYYYTNRKAKYKIIYFGDQEKDNVEKEIDRACKMGMDAKRPWNLEGLQKMAWDAGYAQSYLKRTNENHDKWWSNYLSHVGAEEGTLRILKLED